MPMEFANSQASQRKQQQKAIEWKLSQIETARRRRLVGHPRRRGYSARPAGHDARGSGVMVKGSTATPLPQLALAARDDSLLQVAGLCSCILVPLQRRT